MLTKTQLLFYDSIYTIVPKNEKDSLPAEYSSFYEALENDIKYVSPEGQIFWPDNYAQNLLEKHFEQIRIKYAPNKDQTEMIFENGNIKIPGHSFLHISKISDEIKLKLKEYHLLPQISNDILKAIGPGNEWLIVEEHASNLIMAHLANMLSKEMHVAPITCESNCFDFNSLIDHSAKSTQDATDLLSTFIISFQIPSEISELSNNEYIKIRNEFKNIREPFHRLSHDLIEFGRIGNESTQEAFVDGLREIANRFDQEYNKFTKDSLARRFSKFIPMSIDTVAKVIKCFPIATIFKIALESVSTTISFLGKCQQNGGTNLEPYVYNRLAQLNKRILSKTDIRHFL